MYVNLHDKYNGAQQKIMLLRRALKKKQCLAPVTQKTGLILKYWQCGWKTKSKETEMKTEVGFWHCIGNAAVNTHISFWSAWVRVPTLFLLQLATSACPEK